MILICFGTRPEYIKVQSLINNLDNIKTCFTGQHKDLLKDIMVDYYLNFEDISNNRLNNIMINILKSTYIFKDIDYVLVQGDTTTAASIALSAYHMQIKVIHLEAGLRTNNIYDPYPEELNRQIISRIADIHLCPTELNKNNLLKENITKNIFVVGNTGLDNINKDGCEYSNQVLVTLHRRNNFHNIDKWFTILEEIANEYDGKLEFILPIHPNPNIKKYKYLLKKVNVIEPLSHEKTIELIKKTKFIISDSGGIQEEASFLNKKIIICRNDTERPEILRSHGILCKNPENLKKFVEEVNKNYFINEECPFGDGYSFLKIKKVLKLFM